MAVKKREGENLSAANIEKVGALLNAEQPITKKAACELLNIPYNTSRLAKILEEYDSTKKHKETMRQRMKTVAVTEVEELSIIKDYLNGEPLSHIAESSYRSVNIIKGIIKKYHLPERDSSNSYSNPVLLPDESIKEDYKSGDLVFSARYAVPALIRALYQVSEEHGPVYAVWLMGSWQQFAYQPYYELGNLTHLQSKVGTDFEQQE